MNKMLLLIMFISLIGCTAEEKRNAVKREEEIKSSVQQNIERCVELGGIPIRNSSYVGQLKDCVFKKECEK